MRAARQARKRRDIVGLVTSRLEGELQNRSRLGSRSFPEIWAKAAQRSHLRARFSRIDVARTHSSPCHGERCHRSSDGSGRRRMDAIATMIAIGLAFYVAAGLVTAIAFVTFGRHGGAERAGDGRRAHPPAARRRPRCGRWCSPAGSSHVGRDETRPPDRPSRALAGAGRAGRASRLAMSLGDAGAAPPPAPPAAVEGQR